MVQVRLRQKDKSIPFFDYKTRYHLNIDYFALLLASVMTASMITACGGGSSSSSAPAQHPVPAGSLLTAPQ